MKQQQVIDQARQDFEDWAASVFGVLTTGQYRVAQAAFLEGARQERARNAQLVVIPDEPSTFDQLVIDGEGRN